MTTKQTKAMTTKTIDELVAAAEQCLAELRRLGRRNQARRAAVQARYADLGQQIRQAFDR